MPRRAQQMIAGIPWRIIQRGNNRNVCFYAEEEYRRYLGILEEQADKFTYAVHVDVLMTNRVHLATDAEQGSKRGRQARAGLREALNA